MGSDEEGVAGQGQEVRGRDRDRDKRRASPGSPSRGKRARGGRGEPGERYWAGRAGGREVGRRDGVEEGEGEVGARYYGGAAGVKAEQARPARKNTDDAVNTRTGGAYIPPARLRMMQANITDKSSAAYQRIAWEALKKSIHGHINKINVGNIGIIIKQLLRENVVRGRGLLCRSIIQAQAASPTFTNVYAALVAAVNSRFPNIGELLLKRLIIQFKRGFKRNDKSICISAATFIAHLVNQRVVHEILALELLTLLVETPTDDSVEVAIAFLKECGQKLTEVSSKGVNAIFEMLRNILHEGSLDKRVQYMIEVIFQIWKDGFKDHVAVADELELVPETEQFTHLMMLDEATDAQDLLNVFKLDEKYEENELKYKELSKEILGSDAESGSEEGSGSGSGSEEASDDEEAGEDKPQSGVTIIDNTETNLIALRRTIYLTINSSLDFEECAHKLMKMQLKPGQEIELCHMFLDCCAEQRTYEKFYGLLAQRFCQINKIYIGPFEEIFRDSYSTAHRLDTNRLRNVSKFFAHLLFTDSISWEALECVKLNEEDTTSSSRIYIKILFQELAEYMGLKKLNDRLRDVTLQEAFSGLFPRDNPKNTRFSINFFTSIGLGGLTDDLREHLKQMPKNIPQQITEINVSGSSSSSSSDSDSSSSSSSDDSTSESEEEKEKSKKTKKTSKKSKKRQEKDSDSDEEDESSSKNKKSSKKSKNKNKPASPDQENKEKENERWGHDGFYETYGSNAVPNTKRNNRPEHGRNNWNNDRQDTDRRNNRKDSERDKERDRNNRDNSEINDQDKRRDREDSERNDRDKRRDRNNRDNSEINDQDKRRDSEDSERNNQDKRRDRGDSERQRNNEDWDVRRESSIGRDTPKSYWESRINAKDRNKDWDIHRESSTIREVKEKEWEIRRESSMRRENRDENKVRGRNDSEKNDRDRRVEEDSERDKKDKRRDREDIERNKKRNKDDTGRNDRDKRRESNPAEYDRENSERNKRRDKERESRKEKDDWDIRRESSIKRERRERRPPVPMDWQKERKVR